MGTCLSKLNNIVKTQSFAICWLERRVTMRRQLSLVYSHFYQYTIHRKKNSSYLADIIFRGVFWKRLKPDIITKKSGKSVGKMVYTDIDVKKYRHFIIRLLQIIYATATIAKITISKSDLHIRQYPIILLQQALISKNPSKPPYLKQMRMGFWSITPASI